MRKIPTKMRESMANDPYYETCARKCTQCQGRITWEHALTYAGRQINEIWAIIPLCEYHHAVNMHQDGGDLKKEINIYIALCRATDEELDKYPRANFKRLRERLIEKYDN